MIQRDKYGKPIFPVKVSDLLDEIYSGKGLQPLGSDWGAYSLTKNVGAIAINHDIEMIEYSPDIFKLHLEAIEKQLPAYQIINAVKTHVTHIHKHGRDSKCQYCEKNVLQSKKLS